MTERTFLQIKKIIREYIEQLYDNKFDDLDKMDTFLERHKLPNLTQEETDSPKSTKEIEFIVKHLPTKKTPGSDGFT